MFEFIFRGALIWIVGWLSLALVWIGYWTNLSITTEQGPFTISIERQAATEREAALIAAAEALCPDEALLEGCPASDITTGNCRWWCEERSGFRIPVGVTGEAWQYFQDEVGKMQQEAESHDIARVTSASLRYTATVRANKATNPNTSVTDVVELKLNWHYYCGGGFCGFSIQLGRRVFFDEWGNVLGSIGDGLPEFQIY